eukprot:2649978-Amphidinium_carterae.1
MVFCMHMSSLSSTPPRAAGNPETAETWLPATEEAGAPPVPSKGPKIVPPLRQSSKTTQM